jgi:hypothetical protein
MTFPQNGENNFSPNYDFSPKYDFSPNYDFSPKVGPNYTDVEPGN